MSLGDLELHGYSHIFSLGVNQSGPWDEFNKQVQNLKALGWLHGPWCKKPLKATQNMVVSATNPIYPAQL